MREYGGTKMHKDSLIYVAGHRGLVGSAIVRCLERQGWVNIITQTSRELDLRSQRAVEEFFKTVRPEYVFLAAAKVGGIWVNDRYPAQFIYDNLAIETNVIHAAHSYGVKKLLFLGSSCIYPKLAPQPLREEYLLTGPLEPTNEWYALAKIAGIKMCQAYRKQYGDNFIAAMPTNLYGLNDNFDLESAHVLPALLRKFHEAKIDRKPCVEVWGSGQPRREFLYIDDLAEACCFLMENYDEQDIVNVGTGQDISIRELAELIGEVVGYSGEIIYEDSKPDGTPVKRLDVSKMNHLGWQAKTELKAGIEKTYQWFQAYYSQEEKSDGKG
jgi:GDP-L-fucose synthase